MKHTPDAPHSIYGVEKWGKGLIEVTEQGEIGLRNPMAPEAGGDQPARYPQRSGRPGHQGPDGAARQSSYLEHEIAHLNESFRDAIARVELQRPISRRVFPIKVNQQAQVVDRIVEFGKKYNYGLEAGSKPELVVALAHSLAPEALIVCNGVKDAEFIQLAILSRKIGFNTVIVLESPKEADTVIEVYNELGIEPLIGVRVKLTNQISGKWEESSGDRSAFGMNTDQLVATVDKLKEAGLLHCLKLQHSHLGSQVQDVNDVRRAVGEACRYYTELTREGVPLTHLDLGGGMGVDYTGEKKAAENSINYTVEEYCANVVETVAYAMDEAEIDHPTLVTESGRAVVATSSMLVFNVLESTLVRRAERPRGRTGRSPSWSRTLAAVHGYLSKDRLQECWNDATFYRNELRALFRRGYVDLRQMARAERIYLSLMARLKALAASDDLETDVDDQLRKWPISTTATSRCSNRCPMSGPSISCTRSCHCKA